MGIPPDKISFPHAPGRRDRYGRGFSPEQADLALATFLVKILMPGFRIAGGCNRDHT